MEIQMITDRQFKRRVQKLRRLHCRDTTTYSFMLNMRVTCKYDDRSFAILSQNIVHHLRCGYLQQEQFHHF